MDKDNRLFLVIIFIAAVFAIAATKKFHKVFAQIEQKGLKYYIEEIWYGKDSSHNKDR